ncbi:cystathionine beta-lyase [Acidocella aminolytica]|uniref:Cystathionine beta-lyase n=1 Tax=Acidocella aminolytica 101 = DSM 11237 TaxID=1120923 RepID=A0A0D6PBK3_9PROT|nr:cystathionine beta-lyase [Acidocella aminolytica]GAN78726.1 cystathionine beta-lyase [Acidocella aminolytica 101 = DSM 11237]GBQ38691.1 cystathionine beta-lyase [Acidocella aminolytica 101 = DSM 11237]SHE78598.1 cystathionine beta-lyase [Acidocella aminolytica 101 = DSM 11237]
MVRKIETALVQAGRAPVKQYGFVNPPLKRGSTVLHANVAAKKAVGQRAALEPVENYGVMGSETHFALEAAIAEIEGGSHAQVTGSGLSAITVPLLAYLNTGEHLLVPDSVYGPTRTFCDTMLVRFGIEATYYDPMIAPGDLAALFRPNTKVLFTESPGSHTFEVQDIPALAHVAHAHGAKVFLDNTWGILHFAPFRHGVDVSIHALTKYPGGHSDIILGAVVVNSEEDWRWLRLGSLQMGNYASPDDCWLALRGLRTMHVRLKAAEAAGLQIANWFAARPEVARVLHPALPTCPGHEFFKRDFTGACGLFGVVFQPRYSAEDVVRMIDALAMFGIGASWGGFESLVLPTTGTIRRTAGTGRFEGEAARFQIGLENIDDLIVDLDQGLAALRGA